MSDSNSGAARSEKLGRGGRTTAERYGREKLSEWGRKGYEAKQQRKARLHAIVLEADKDICAQIANNRDLWERCAKLSQESARDLRGLLEYCKDRTEGKPVQAHIVAVEARIAESELERARQVARGMRPALERSRPCTACGVAILESAKYCSDCGQAQPLAPQPAIGPPAIMEKAALG